jgi:predicted AlkP superfamily pyrophosphatase or phosphodiesterase
MKIKYNIILIALLLFVTNVFVLQAKDKPIVILVSLDGFRWDYLERGYSPNLNKISESGVRALSLRPQFPSMTFPNHYSIITGLLPENHGIIANHFINPFNDSLFTLKSPFVNRSEWYLGEAFWETARRNGLITASYFWPGSEMDLEYRRPNYYEKYHHQRPYEIRVEGVLNWLKLPDSVRPDFITLYFDETDSKAHRFGTDSYELNRGISRVDSMIAKLDSGLIALGIQNKVNLIIISDHGMTNMYPDRIINLNKILNNDSTLKIYNSSTMAFIFPKNHNKSEIYNLFKKNENGYRVYYKNDIPDRYNYKNHPFIGEIVLIAEPSWQFNSSENWDSTYIATHGYDNHYIDMQGIFIARGPAFKNNYKSGSLNNLDIYPLLCKIFNINPSGNIDGDLINIIHLLKD